MVKRLLSTLRLHEIRGSSPCSSIFAHFEFFAFFFTSYTPSEAILKSAGENRRK